MACSCMDNREDSNEYVWTDGTEEIVYSTKIQAKAKVLRSGGSYTARPKG